MRREIDATRETPIASSVPSCSEPSRYGLARAEHAERLVRRPTLTAPARAGFAILRVGAKKRVETGQEKIAALKPLDKKDPIQGEVAIFNRSHYADVLVVRVPPVWSKRYGLINDFE